MDSKFHGPYFINNYYTSTKIFRIAFEYNISNKYLHLDRDYLKKKKK